MYFKLYGERNSGITFLNKLIELNYEKILYQTLEDNICIEWQHRMPRVKKNDRIDIFIVRDLNKWLISTFNNPYHLNSKSNFIEFLLEKQKSNEQTIFCYDIDNNIKELNYDDNDKTIFEIRYNKYNEMINFFKNNKNVILVNQSYLLDNKNVETFLNKINELFKLNKSCDWKYINYNIKTSHKNISYSKEKYYDTNITRHTQQIINIFKNENIENYISNLKFIIKTDNYEYIQE